nr:immunoglobulin light chain junction region [Macaca mulatta]MOW16317.1 immunoglobulin light chain junction region [Macaca mulatta]MOW17572.1 immunoglobulin light chain junction region [Macaca mulatta]MOW17662.1 immunoglobulin light chain junction region [Macaca mulatta]MOW17836.1 immunoglobulin light chain junction region [Macaca mulatta]
DYYCGSWDKSGNHLF